MQRMNLKKTRHYTYRHASWKGDCNAFPRLKAKTAIRDEVNALLTQSN